MCLLTRVGRPVLNPTRFLSRARILSYKGREGTELTTDDINRGFPFQKVFFGIAASAGLLFYAIYTTEHGQERKETYFAERYPDPRIKVLHQEIAIPDIMVDLTREYYCKDEWFNFEKCLGEKTDIKQIGTNVWDNLQKMKELSVDKECRPVRDALHECQVKAMYDEELYFSAKDIFLERQDKLLISGMPKIQTDALEDMVQKEIPIYNRFDEQGKEWIIDTVKKFGKEHIYLDKDGNWIDFEEGLIAESEAKDEKRVRQTYNRRRRELAKRIKELEAEIEAQQSAEAAATIEQSEVPSEEVSSEEVPSNKQTA